MESHLKLGVCEPSTLFCNSGTFLEYSTSKCTHSDPLPLRYQTYGPTTFLSEERCSSAGLLILTLRSAYRPKGHTLSPVLLYTDGPCATLKARDHPAMQLSISTAGSSSSRRSGGFKRSVEKAVPVALALPVGGAPALPSPHPGKPFQNYERCLTASPPGTNRGLVLCGFGQSPDPVWESSVGSVPGSRLGVLCGVGPRGRHGRRALGAPVPDSAAPLQRRQPGRGFGRGPRGGCGAGGRTRPTPAVSQLPARSPSRSGTAALT